MFTITQIHVIACRNIHDLDIDLSVPKASDRPFHHLILTGPNGSGKTGLLEAMRAYLKLWHSQMPLLDVPTGVLESGHRAAGWNNLETTEPSQWEQATGCRISWNGDLEAQSTLLAAGRFVQMYIPARHGNSAKREALFNVARSPTASFFNQAFSQNERVAPYLLQFLVNKKTEQAFAASDGDHKMVAQIDSWFDTLWDQFRELMEEPKLKVAFDRKSYSFNFTRTDGHRFDFNTMADGHAAAVTILAELMLRLEAAGEQSQNPDQEPWGVVLIDEIEAHLHPSMQERILPFFTALYPRIQFIVATHSPAVISSIDGAVVFDLHTHKSYLSDELRGIPYGTLMTSLFGIKTDFDLESTRKLERLETLFEQSERSPQQEQELEDLADELRRRSHTLAMEVWAQKKAASGTHAAENETPYQRSRAEAQAVDNTEDGA
ncbi:MAG: AAA family ATPase [Deltaproteobacteria bacterium]|nr:AAA family ATPase [Deltaproteobacteria bacterium]